MLDHPLIEVRTDRLRERTAHVIPDHIIYTGPIDKYFDFRFGKLPYRSLEFRHETWIGTVPAGRDGQLSRTTTALHADQRVQAPDRPGSARDDDHL